MTTMDQFERDKILASKYERKMMERTNAIKHIVARQMASIQTAPHEARDLRSLFPKQFDPAFEAGKYGKPSEFFLAEMPWVMDLVYPRFREAFLYAVDQVREYPYSVGWCRRSFRSEDYASYADRIFRILYGFMDPHCLDGDLMDILTGNLPEDARAYLISRKTRTAGFVPEVLACALDREHPELESVVTDIINGDNEFSTVSRELIRGILMSHNPRMHRLICRLLVAAKLQEGLRQVICEEADGGSREGFLAVLNTILEEDLIRFSSVKRAVGTWIGVVGESVRDLDRVSGKSVELIVKCLSDPAYQADCLDSEDAMAIHSALWSLSFESTQKAIRAMDRILENGTHHQVLAAGYFVANLDDYRIRHTAARKVLKSRRERNDILAVYLPQFLTDGISIAVRIPHQQYPEIGTYFESREDAAEFCDWLSDTFRSMKKKELEFSPCIFPWYSAKLQKSDLLEKAMVIAAMLRDQERMDGLSGHLSDCSAYARNSMLAMLAHGKKTPAIRKAILNGMQDKSLDTREMAYMIIKGMKLIPEEYRRIEEMLRLRYEDLRRNVMDLLMKQTDDALLGSVNRLLGSPKQQIRTAGLDMVKQLAGQEGKEALFHDCMEAVRAISNPTTQEKILIDELLPKDGPREKLQFTEADRYAPVVEIGEYERECIRFFMEQFPDSRLEQQVFAGEPVIHDGVKNDAAACASAEKAKEHIRSLSEFFVAHELETYRHWDRELPLGGNFKLFVLWNDGKRCSARMDLWEQWRSENRITFRDLFGMLVALHGQPNSCPYLIRCGKYIADLYGAGFENRVHVRYEQHIQQIVYDLIYQNLTMEQTQQMAMALGIWIARCLPEDMYLGGNEDFYAADASLVPEPVSIAPNIRIAVAQQRQRTEVAGHFIEHPQIYRILYQLSRKMMTHLKHWVPVQLSVFEGSFSATKRYLERIGKPETGRVTLLLNQIYRDEKTTFLIPPQPSDYSYVYACHCGLISERTMLCHLITEYLSDALRTVTAICAVYPDGEAVGASGNFGRAPFRSSCEVTTGKGILPEEERKRLIALFRRAADVLVPMVVDVELKRGDTPTEYSKYISGIHLLSGAENFVRILAALGRDPLDRNAWYSSSDQSRRGNLSHLLSRCVPTTGDTPEKLRQLLQNTDITEQRLVEAALYSPSWIDLVGEYRNLPGFKSACYYFMAHMNEEFDEEKKAVIARFTPLTEEELNLGAFDLDWFHSAYEQLGEAKFNLIYDAAKYISDGSKHTRARKYADAALGRMAVADTEAEVSDKRNKDLLMAYAIIPLTGEEDLIHRYLYLQQFLKESRQFGSQRATNEKKAVETALRNLATNAHFADTMRLTLRMETKLVEDNRELFRKKQIGEWNLWLEVDGQGSAAVRCEKDGKLLKSIPAKVKKDPYVLRLGEMKKQLVDQYRRTRRMFEQAMEDCTAFTLEEMRQLWENPVVAPIVSKLVFRSGEMLGLFDGTHLVDFAGEKLVENGDAVLQVAHPVHLFAVGRWHEMQQYLYDNRIIQPFRQVFRELYVKNGAELGCTTSLRYAGNQIQPKKAAACLKERRWVADIDSGLQKVYYQHNIVATIYALADWFTPADIEAPTLEYVAFYDRKNGQGMKIDDIPEVIFSEVMRDVDMAVSVAHAGGVDPETSHSTVEMRGAILSFTLPLLRLNNVRIEGNHAFIDGKLARYSVHLGSGVVHQIGGSMLSVLPVHSQHRGRIFLPFVDEDPKTAEILSKVILFAEDHKLKDPTILEQISR